MQQENEISATIDYTGTGKTRTGDVNQDRVRTVHADQTESAVLVELVVIDGPEGQKLHAIQAEVIHRILSRLAERQMQDPQNERRL